MDSTVRHPNPTWPGRQALPAGPVGRQGSSRTHLKSRAVDQDAVCGRRRYRIPMPLAELQIRKLFGRFDHRIELNQQDHITILHGANGVGKTTVLRVIDDFFHRRLAALRRIPFESIEMRFTSGELLTIVRSEPDDDRPRRSICLEISMKKGRRKPTEPFIVRAPNSSDAPFPPSAVDEFLPWLEQIGPREWFDSDTSRVLDFEDVLDEYSDALPTRPARESYKRPAWLETLAASPAVHMIETQRLSAPRREVLRQPRRYQPHREARRGTTAVRLLAEDLAGRIRTALASYAERSQEFDRSFPNRVLADSRSPSAATDAAIRERYEVQGQSRARLMAAGLLDPGEEVLIRGDLSETERKVLWTYLGDVDRKLEVLYPIADKIDLFRAILNTKYIGKRVVVHRQAGFQVLTDDNQLLNPEFLSSGEQHELVLAYRLLFDVEPGSLILIDEPELSLHVSWQQMFLPDLERISRTAELDFLIATHSPTIIGNRWDLTTQLSVESE